MTPRAIILLAALALAPTAGGAPLARTDVPEPLRPWIDWSLHGSEAKLCPNLLGSAEVLRCAWPARISLVADAGGGRFTQTWQVEAEQWVPLPGDSRRPPLDVRVDGAAVAAVPLGSGLAVRLVPGSHTVSGVFHWDAMPEALVIPAETGLVDLVLDGRQVLFPDRDAEGRVWLRRAAAAGEGEETLGIVVHRLVRDDVPLLLTTRIELRVSGKSREALLGRVIPEGFLPLSMTGPLPARLEADSRLRVQLRPGTFVLEIVARSTGPVTSLSPPPPDGPWPGEEAWAFLARNHLRVVAVEGVPAIDPQQTTIPDAWRALPTYRVRAGDTMRLTERRRGDADPAPDELTLERTLWLDFDGRGYTIHDRITGRLSASSRLEMAAPTVLGHVAISGQDQFITRLDEKGLAGVEVRARNVDVAADSRLDGAGRAIPAVGWNHDFHQVSATLHLPPGFRLLTASGADDVPDTWLRRWTLLDLFLVLVTSLAVAKLWGRRLGGVMLVTLLLTFPEQDAPRWIWLVVLAFEALCRVLPTGKLRALVGFGRAIALVVLVVMGAGFGIDQARRGLYPALEYPWLSMPSQVPAQQGYAASGGGVAGNVPMAPPPMSRSMRGKVAEVADELMTKGDAQDQVQAQRADSYSYDNLLVHDPKAIVQTGPGLPQWSWNQIALGFSGPVERTQALKLWLLPPAVTRSLCFLRLLLVLALVVRAVVRAADLGRMLGPPAAASVAIGFVLAVALVPAAAGAAEIPGPDVLAQLRDRLLERPACFPSCASCSRLDLHAGPAGLELRLELAAAAATAVPLPGGREHWTPARVVLDGQEARGLLRSGDGSLWILLPPGVHQVTMAGPLPDRETIALPLPLRPARVEVRLDGYTVEGLHEDGIAEASLLLTRKSRAAGASAPAEAMEGSGLPALVRIERDVVLGLSWQVETRVERISPPGAPIMLEVPLLPGESVTTADVRVEGGKALVTLGPRASSFAWSSVLEERPRIELRAATATSWTEVWRLSASPVWHVAFEGIPVIHSAEGDGGGGARLPEWWPWPGESVTITVSRPQGVPGQTVTIDRSVVVVTPGQRATDAVLDLDLRSSRGGEHTITLPAGARLESVEIDGASEPLRQDGAKVILPLVPGARHVKLALRESRGVSLRTTAPAIDLGVPSVNAEVHVAMPASRWILFTRGPRMGPAILFWGVLGIIALLSAILGRVRLTPLRSHHWFLLGVGLTQSSVWVWALIAGWLLLLGLRRDRGRAVGNKAFDLGQILLALWTAVALASLVASLERGLLGLPEMQVSGNGSSPSLLRWYQDRSAAALPQPAVISAPLLVYRLLMLAWALWLAASLLGWLRWGYSCFTTGGGWRPFFRRRAPAVLASMPPPPAPAP